jgi:hypothetical protein
MSMSTVAIRAITVIVTTVALVARAAVRISLGNSTEATISPARRRRRVLQTSRIGPQHLPALARARSLRLQTLHPRISAGRRRQ